MKIPRRRFALPLGTLQTVRSCISAAEAVASPRVESFEMSCERTPNGTSMCPKAGVLEDLAGAPDAWHDGPVFRRARYDDPGRRISTPQSTFRWMPLHPVSQYHRGQLSWMSHRKEKPLWRTTTPTIL